VSDVWQRVRSLLDEAVDAGVAPSAALAVGCRDTLMLEAYAGFAGAEATGPATTYDLSSLTKPLATVALLMQACAHRSVDLAARVDAYAPEFAKDASRASVTVRDLLAHCSGLPAHRNFFLDIEVEERRNGTKLAGTAAGKAWIEALAAREPLEYEPRARAVYSDIGFILLGRILELRGERRLDELFRMRIAEPLGLEDIGFVDLEAPRSSLSRAAAPCGHCSWRKAEIRGEVQDQNAWAMGGIAGHAGLFATLRAVHMLASEHVRAWNGTSTVLPGDVLRTFWSKDTNVPGGTWALGWDTPSVESSSAGSRIGEPAFGHLGFTGTSIWIDLSREVHVVFLTNRIASGADNAAIRALRPRVHDAVFEALDQHG
jgi:serine-type D-Ala-D-Ala carboxypeptidase